MTGSTGVVFEARKLRKVYHTGEVDVVALHGVDLELNAGELVCLLGASGSGKSTLLNILAGIDSPTSGEVFVAGTPLHALKQNRIAIWRGRNLGVVFQFFQLLPTLTVIENVMLPMDFCNTFPARERPGRALHLLEQVGVAQHAYKLPAALSGGEQQRAAIARAQANDPQIIVADEPTGNLDSHTADAVLDLFVDLSRSGKTIVMVTHERDISHLVTRTVTLADGIIAQQPETPRG